MQSVGIGIIGCGGRIRGLVKRLKAEVGERVHVVAVCDPSEASVHQTREKFNPDARVYEDYRPLVTDPDVAWVMIGSWNCYHSEHAVAALDAGKDVFCEKPLATTLDDCLAMRDARERSGRRFFIGFTLRYSPHYRRIKQLLDDGAVGRIISMEFNETLEFNHGGYIHQDWRRLVRHAGTHLLEKCCHDIDVANWFVDSLATRVASFGGMDFFTPENAHHAKRIGPSPANGRPAYQAYPASDNSPFLGEKDIVDNQVGILQYANGVRATFHTNCHSALPERRSYILGTEGAIRADMVAGRVEVQHIGWGTEPEVYTVAQQDGHGGSDDILAKAMAACMLEGAQPPSRLEDGLRSAVTCFAMDESVETGQLVDVRPYWQKAGLVVVEAKRNGATVGERGR